MSGIRSLESFPNAVLDFVLQLPRNLWSAAVHPVPKLMSTEVKSTDLLTPLAYFGVLMATAMLLNQLWLFTFSAFCIVWVETQMAWKAQETGKAKADAHIAESIASAQSITTSKIQSKDVKELIVPDFLQQTKEDLMNHFANNITSATVCVFPTQVMTTQFSAEEQERIESQIERSLEIQLEQQRQNPPSYHAPPPRFEGLQTVLEEDEPSTLGDRNFTLMSDMAVVQRELAQVLGLRRRRSSSSSTRSKIDLASLDYPLRPHGPQPAIVIEDVLDDNVSNIFSMEELDDEPSTTASSIHDDSHSTRSLSFPRSPVAFPIIDDVLSEYEANLHALEPHQNVMNDDIDEALTSGDESQHNAIFSDDDDDDYDGIRSASPAATSVDGADDVGETHPKSVITTMRKPIVRRRSSTKKSPPKKNNGWKTIPKKSRLNSRQKKKFVSKAFW